LCEFTGCEQFLQKKNENTEEHYRFDIENNIAYKVEHDDSYLYLELKTDDETTIQKIFMHGLFVYVDPKGGRSKDIYFNYPLKKRPEPGNMKHKMKDGENGQREFSVDRFLDRVSMEAIYSKKDEAEKIPVFSSSDWYMVELSARNPSTLIYKLRIPLEETGNANEFSLGIMTGKVDMPSMGDHSGGSQGGGQGGGPGAGMQGGGGRPSGGMQDGQSGGVNRESMMDQLSIWFQVDLGNHINQ
jgi:hypothetical protein